jgi:hypothetical protein
MGRITFACAGCGKPYTVGPGLVGRKVRCSGCGHVFRVTGNEPVEEPVGVSLALEGLDEGPAAGRAVARSSRERTVRPQGAGLWASIRSGLEKWDRATGRDGETDDMKQTRRGGFGLIFGGFIVGSVFPRTNLRLRGLQGLPVEVHYWIGVAMAVGGIGMVFVYAARYPLRAFRSILEMMVILAAVSAIGFLIIKPWMMDNRP